MAAELITSLGESQSEAEQDAAENSITEMMINRGAAILSHLQDAEESLSREPQWFRVGSGYLLYRHVYEVFTAELW